MAKFVTRPGGHDGTYEGPYTARGVNLRIYTLDASYAALAATVTRYLGPVSAKGETFFPLGDRVFGCFAAMNDVVGIDPLLGSMREIDVAFFIPLIRFSGIVPKGIVFFAPYLFVDIPQAMATGREVHGYRKDFGTSFSAVDTYAAAWKPSAADLTHVEAWAVATPGTRVQRMRLVDVQAPGPANPAVPWQNPAAAALEIAGELIGDIKQLLGVVGAILGKQPGFAEALLRQVLVGFVQALLGKNDLTVPIAFLRQFRDPKNSAQADVQQLVIADTAVPLASLSGGKLPAGYAITFHDTVSHPFSVELGLTSGVAIPSGLTMEASCDFTLGHGK